jgi:hypothetical protein
MIFKPIFIIILRGIIIGVLIGWAQGMENKYPHRNISTVVETIMVAIWMIFITEPIFLVLFWNLW